DSGTVVDGGAAFVFLGSASGVPSGTPSNARATLTGNQAGSFFGQSVAPAGDVNGDGYGDVIVGAYAYDAGETNEGVAFVYLGGPTGLPSGAPQVASAQLESNLAGATLGYSVASAGDVNGDGYTDLIAGAPVYENDHTDEGAA